jgi:hypothetical protein
MKEIVKKKISSGCETQVAIRTVGGRLLTTNPTGARSAREASCGQPMATKHLFGLTAALR